LHDDASEAVRDEAIIKGLGTIRLVFYRVVHEGTTELLAFLVDKLNSGPRNWLARAPTHALASDFSVQAHFVFAPIALTDDASEAVRDEAIIKGLGTIRLDFYRFIWQSPESALANVAGDSARALQVEQASRGLGERKHQVGKTTCYIAAEEGKEFEVQVDPVNQPSTDECSRTSGPLHRSVS
jgi:hypothetical protein